MARHSESTRLLVFSVHKARVGICLTVVNVRRILPPGIFRLAGVGVRSIGGGFELDLPGHPFLITTMSQGWKIAEYLHSGPLPLLLTDRNRLYRVATVPLDEREILHARPPADGQA
ncbi:MAG TPA: hypothetical protein VD969_29205 [Symbiobacteriaceae bacterium]|nr:hypothetical protein [Symbiobacteriaceae bacterium]